MLVKRNIKSQVPSIFDAFLTNDDYFSKSLSFSKPEFNLYETDDKFTIEIAIPGMQKDDFKIELNNNILTISSEKEETEENDDKKYHQRSFKYGSFKSSYALSDNLNKDEIDAKYENGILKLEIKKLIEQKESKQISIK